MYNLTLTGNLEGTFFPHLYLNDLPKDQNATLLQYHVIFIYHWGRALPAMQTSDHQQEAPVEGKKMKGTWEVGWRERLHNLDKGPGWNDRQQRSENFSRTGESSPAGKASSQSAKVRCCKAKFELSLRFMVIYLSLKGNRRAGARPNSSLLSSWWKTTWGKTTCMKKENWISVKNRRFYRFSFDCQSTMTHSRCIEVGPFSASEEVKYFTGIFWSKHKKWKFWC